MSNKKSFDKVRSGIESGIYKLIRLVKDGEAIISWNKNSREELVKRFEYIQHKLNDLPAGKYELEVCVSNTRQGLKESFPLVVTEKKTITIQNHNIVKGETEDKIIDVTKDQETMNEIDFEEYKDLLKKNANLTAINEVLKLKVEYLEKQLSERPLNDAPVGTGGKIIETISEHIPTALHIFDKFLDQRDRQMDLKDRELSLQENGLSSGGRRKVKKIKVDAQQKSKEEILSEMETLSDSNPDAFEATLDEMESKDPELYDYICEQLGLFDNDEETEQE